MDKEYSAKKLRARYYDKIIEINVPIRFYWVDGEFDGIEFGPFEKPISKYQIHLIYEALDTIQRLMGGDDFIVNDETKHKAERRKTPIPDTFIKAFRKREKQE